MDENPLPDMPSITRAEVEAHIPFKVCFTHSNPNPNPNPNSNPSPNPNQVLVEPFRWDMLPAEWVVDGYARLRVDTLGLGLGP